MIKNILLLSLLFMSTIKFAQAQQPTPKEAFLEKWQNSSAYLLAMVESIPESSLDYQPTERQMTIKEQLLHIRSNMLWLSGAYFNPNQIPVPDRNRSVDSKEALQEALQESFKTVSQLIENTEESALDETVDFFAGPKSRLQILNLLQDHVTHHRGQLIVYLNLLDITPPRYSGW